MSGMIIVVFASILTFFILLFYTRLIGKKQMSQLTYFNYITGITIGSMGANLIFKLVTTLNEGIVALSIWTLLTILLGFITLKSIKVKVFIDGKSTIVIEKGKLKKDALRKLRLNINDLSMLLREKNVFSLSQVDYAVFEPNGKLSVLKEINKQEVTKEDLKVIVATPKYIPTIVITDGNFNEANIKQSGLTKEWIMTQLKAAGFDVMENLTYVEVLEDGKLFIDYK